MDIQILIAVALAPIVFVGWFILRRDRYEPEPRKLILKTFIIGALFIFPVIIAELVLSIVIPESNNPIILFLHVLLVVALVEESSKYASVRLSVYKSPQFNEMIDGIVYGGVAGLGFATPENLLYVLQSGPIVGILRAVLSVPGHAIWGSIVGYYVARQKLKSKRAKAALTGLGVAVLLHTAFDYAIFAVGSLLGLGIAALTIAVSWFLFFRFSKAALLASPFRSIRRIPTQGMHTLQPPRYCTYCGSSIGIIDRFCSFCGARQ